MNEDGAREITPQPTPFTTDAGVMQTGEGPVVRITFKLITGTVTLFCKPEDAQTVGEMIVSRARIAKTGIVLPEGTMLPPANPEQS